MKRNYLLLLVFFGLAIFGFIRSGTIRVNLNTGYQYIDNQAINNFGVTENLTPRQVRRDVRFVIKKLKKNHYSLDWEHREKEVIDALNKIASTTENITEDSFFVALNSIVSSIDDGHTYLIHSMQKRKKKMFKCELVDEETILLRIPSFMSYFQMGSILRKFELLKALDQVDRVIIDLRGNKGGAISSVQKLLTSTMSHDFQLYERVQLKPGSGFNGVLENSFSRFRGFRRSGDYLIKHGKQIPIKNRKIFKHKYLLVDSTIISASMLATYHLKKDGFVVLGSNPKSLFNTFGNVTMKILPKSDFYLIIATMRVIVDENVENRRKDQLRCDYPLINNEIPIGLLEQE